MSTNGTDAGREARSAGITPGPWHIEFGVESGIWIGAERDECKIVAIATREGLADLEPPANARLIAAAPNLLAACRAALDYDAAIQRYAVHGKSWVEGDDLDALYERWIDLAQAAISRATNAER